MNQTIKKGEPLFEDVNNPGGWSLYTFRPMFEPRGGKYIRHAMLAGAVPVPINAVTGKREMKVDMSSSTKDGNKKIQQERIVDLVQPGKIYSLKIETLNWMWPSSGRWDCLNKGWNNAMHCSSTNCYYPLLTQLCQ